MVVGELVPKSLAIARPRATAYALATPMVVITRVLGPLIRFLNGAANWTVRRLGIEPQEELTSVRSLEELELLIRASGEEGTLEPEALTLLTRSIRFGEKDAADALVPRRSVQSIVGRRRGVDPRRASGGHRPLALPGRRRRPRRRARRRPREGRVRRARTRSGAPARSRRSWRRPSSCPRPATSPTCSPTSAASGATSRSSSTSTAARPASSPSRTSSRRSSARSTTSTTGRRRASPACSAPGSGCSTAPCTPTRCSTPAASRSPRATTRPSPGSCSPRSAASPSRARRSTTTAGGSRSWSSTGTASRPCGSGDRRRLAEARVVTATSLLVALLLLLANGFFVAVEFALIASRRTKLEALAEQGSTRRPDRGRVDAPPQPAARRRAARHHDGVAAPRLRRRAGGRRPHRGRHRARSSTCPSGVLHTIGFVVALTIVAFLHMVIGEMVPKNVAIADPERTLLALAVPNRAYVTVFGPVLRVLNAPVERRRAAARRRAPRRARHRGVGRRARRDARAPRATRA